ncbi:hypothetical protein [Streptomyces chartreusis]|uniref:hypothetical protein n=1 Tax=Streptomyces chartreusis TaxID=1969 RepID=UPI0037F319D7
MTKGDLGLCSLYLATTLWLTWCAVTGWDHEPTWVSLLILAASLIAIIATVRETVLANERRLVTVLFEREARRSGISKPPPDGAPLDADQQAVWQVIATHWDDQNPA